MNKCKCGSYAINRHRQTIDSDLTKCDVCFWSQKYLEVKSELDKMNSERNGSSDDDLHSVQKDYRLYQKNFEGEWITVSDHDSRDEAAEVYERMAERFPSVVFKLVEISFYPVPKYRNIYATLLTNEKQCTSQNSRRS